MGKLVDVTGRRFGRLVVLGRSNRTSPAGVLWQCTCDCGGSTATTSLKLRSGHSASCGCYQDEVRTNLKHGQSHAGSRTYKTWKEMRQRCLNPKNDKWKWYGARGIAVCERWASFENFLADMGERPGGMTLDRIDNDRSYSPDNCRWATHVEQTRKQAKNKLNMERAVALRVERAAGATLRELGRSYGVSATTAHRAAEGRTWS